MKIFVYSLFVLCLSLPAFSQGAPYAVLPPTRACFANNGQPLAGGFVFAFVANTSTPQATYTDSTGTALNSNPVTLDAQGCAQIWIGAATYDIAVQNSLGVQQYRTNGISDWGQLIKNGGYVDLNSNQTVGGNKTLSGNLTVKGATSLCLTNGDYLHGECYGSLAAAIASADCPVTGCTIDMTSPLANQALGTINAGSKVVKIILGPFQTYTMTNLVCTTGLDFGGQGMIGNGGGTMVTSSGTNAQPMLTALQQNTYAIGCNIHDMMFAALPGNTSQEGLFWDVSLFTGASVQNFNLSNLWFTGFNGSSLEFKSRPTDALSAIQFGRITNVSLQSGAAPTAAIMKWTGYIGQISGDDIFINSLNTQDVAYFGPNGGTGNYGAAGNYLRNTTLQGSGVCAHFGAAVALTLDGGFVEGCPTIFSVTQDSSTAGTNSNNGIIIKGMYDPGTAGATTVLSDTDQFSIVSLENNGLYAGGTFLSGANASRVSYCGNYGMAAALGCNSAQPWKFANNLLISNTAPTIASGFGTSPSVTVNNGTAAFKINVGTGGAATSGVIGLPTATNGWRCTADDVTTQSTTVFLTKQTASTTTSATIGNFNTAGAAAAWVASDILVGSCTAF